MFHKLMLNGMNCLGCKQKIENTIQSLPGINRITVYHTENFIDVTYDEEIVNLDVIISEIEELGFEVKYN